MPIAFCGTPLTPTSYGEWAAFLYGLHGRTGVRCVDFTNTQILVLRLIDPAFRAMTGSVDYFVPDSMPLTWCVNWAAGKHLMPDRVYGPEFMKRCLADCPAEVTHYFLGASAPCLADLIEAVTRVNPKLQIVGSQDGYFPETDRERVVAEISRLSPDLVWVGLGTPKQHAFSDWAKPRLRRGCLLNVGFAFDVNAGWKPDAPRWVQRAGLTWLFRMLTEPRRLIPRYVKFNSLFLLYAIEWFGAHRIRPWCQRHAASLLGLIAVASAAFALWVVLRFPWSLTPLLGQALCGVSAWGSWRCARRAEALADPDAPGTKSLWITAWAAGGAALTHLLIVPLAGISLSAATHAISVVLAGVSLISGLTSVGMFLVRRRRTPGTRG